MIQEAMPNTLSQPQAHTSCMYCGPTDQHQSLASPHAPSPLSIRPRHTSHSLVSPQTPSSLPDRSRRTRLLREGSAADNAGTEERPREWRHLQDRERGGGQPAVHAVSQERGDQRVAASAAIVGRRIPQWGR